MKKVLLEVKKVLLEVKFYFRSTFFTSRSTFFTSGKYFFHFREVLFQLLSGQKSGPEEVVVRYYWALIINENTLTQSGHGVVSVFGSCAPPILGGGFVSMDFD